MSGSPLYAGFVLAAKSEFAKIGFKKRADGMFTIDLGADFLGWVGLNHGHRGKIIDVNPVVGIRSQEIENKVSAFFGVKSHQYIPPTISVSLGYLMLQKSFQPWVIEGESDLQSATDLAENLVRYGLYEVVNDCPSHGGDSWNIQTRTPRLYHSPANCRLPDTE
jgi:hypothetical protein